MHTGRDVGRNANALAALQWAGSGRLPGVRMQQVLCQDQDLFVPMFSSLLARFRSFVAPELQLDRPEARAQAQRLNAFVLLWLGAIGVTAGVHVVSGRWASAAAGLAVFAATLGIRRWALRNPTPPRLERAALGVVFAVLLLSTIRAMLNGQSRAVINWTFALIPMFAAYLVGARWAVRIAVAAIACLLLIHLSGAYMPMGAPALQSPRFLLIGQLLALIVLTAMSVSQRRIAERHIAELEAQHRTIQGQAEELARARDAALTAAHLQGQFLANVSHELRTPLHGVIGMTQVLQTTPLTPEQRDFVATIRASGEGLLALVNDLLDLSKLEAGQMALELRPFALRAWLAQTLDIVAPQAREQGLVLALDVAEDAPAQVVADPHRLRQVLLNLLGNAVKFTERGEVVLRAQVESRPAAGRGPVMLRFSVSDTGVGISQDLVAQLFQPFRQADPSISRRYGGTGLGLAISKHLCELMGGTIHVDSVPGQGTSFVFTVRAEEAPRAAEVPSPEALPRAGARPAALRILLADDNAINRKVGREMLKRLGYEADVACHGLEVLGALERVRYDVVLMDAQMPELDGLSTTRRIRAELPAERQPYIIAVTASAMPSDRSRCAEAGMDDFVSKPVEFETLAAALDRAAGRRSPGLGAPSAASVREAPAAEVPLIEAAQLDSLRRLYEGEPGKLAELVDEHLAESQRLLETLRAALARGDGQEAYQAAHSWKGNSGMFGAKRLSALCAQVELLSREGKLDAAAPLLAPLEALFEATGAALRASVASAPAEGAAPGDGVRERDNSAFQG